MRSLSVFAPASTHTQRMTTQIRRLVNMLSEGCHSPRLMSKLRPEAAARLQQGTPQPLEGRSASSGRKRIVFSRVGPRVSYIEAQSKSDHPNLWFTESEKVVTKPLSFCIPAHEKVSIEIDTQVQITGIAATSSSSLGSKQKLAAAGMPMKRPRAHTTLEVCDNRDGAVMDSMDNRLARLRRSEGGHHHKKSPVGRFFAVASVMAGDGIAKVGLVIPAGAYVLHCRGDDELTVFGQAADVERQLI